MKKTKTKDNIKERENTVKSTRKYKSKKGEGST